MSNERDRPDWLSLPCVSGAEAEELARLIYDAVFLPDEEVDDGVMPPFEEARTLRTGGYERALVAARMVAIQIRRPGQP